MRSAVGLEATSTGSGGSTGELWRLRRHHFPPPAPRLPLLPPQEYKQRKRLGGGRQKETLRCETAGGCLGGCLTSSCPPVPAASVGASAAPPRLTARAPRHNCRCLIFHPGALADPTLLSTR